MGCRDVNFASTAQPLMTDGTRPIIVMLVSYYDYAKSEHYRGQIRFLTYQETPQCKHKTKLRNKAKM